MAVNFIAGAQIGRFVLEAEIGHGSTGIVYRALDPVSRRQVALKILAQHLTLDTRAQERFGREAAQVAKLKHPNIAQIYEFAALPECVYLASEWVEGSTLAVLLKDRKPMPLERALKLFDQLASALDYAHGQGVIHYDIKPANVMVTPDDHVVIVDFELAWLSDAPASTNAGMLFGTPRYMAPEQIRGETVDGQADLYSLAAMLFEMLTGQPPFIGESTPTLLYHHLYTPPPPITEVNPSLPIPVETALLRALAKRPLNRFASATEFGLALRSPTPWPYHAMSVGPNTAPPPTSIRRRLFAVFPVWLWWVVAGSVVLWLLAFMAYQAYRLTTVPIPTMIVTLTPKLNGTRAAPAGGTFSPPRHSPTPDADDLFLPSATSTGDVGQGNSLMLTAESPGLDISIPVTMAGVDLAMVTLTPSAGATPTRFTATGPTPTEHPSSPTPPASQTPATSFTPGSPVPTTPSSATVTLAPSVTPAPTATLAPGVTRAPTATASTPTSPAPTLTASATTTRVPTVTRTLVPSPAHTSTPDPTLTPTATFLPTNTETPIPLPTATPTMAAPAAGGWWPMPSGDAAYSGFVADGFSPLNSTPRWQVPASGGAQFGVVVGNGFVVYSTTGTDVRTLNWATGAAVWNRSLGVELAGDLVLDTLSNGQTIIVAPTTTGLLALSLQTGATLWRNTSGGLLTTPLGGVTTSSDGTLYAVTDTGWLYALNPTDGTLQWYRQLTPSDEFALPPTLSGMTLLTASRNKVVRGFGLSSRTTLWAKTLSENLVTPPSVSQATGLVYVGDEKGRVYALRLSSGLLAWSTQASGQLAGLAYDDMLVYATTRTGNVSAWDGASGALIWSVSAGSPISSPPLTDGNAVLVTTQGGQVRYYSTISGQEIGSQRLSVNDAFYQAAAPAGGWLFVRGSSIYGVSP